MNKCIFPEQKKLNEMFSSKLKLSSNNRSDENESSVNQINRKEINCVSKIPVLNPNSRSTKCASWAGVDCPLSDLNTGVAVNDLTPGMN